MIYRVKILKQFVYLAKCFNTQNTNNLANLIKISLFYVKFLSNPNIKKCKLIDSLRKIRNGKMAFFFLNVILFMFLSFYQKQKYIFQFIKYIPNIL